MKKYSPFPIPHSYLILSIASLILFSFSCNLSKSSNSSNDLFSDNPATITWEEGDSADIKSYQADVEVYSMNNRKDLGTKLTEKYRITISQIDGKIYTRLDFNPAFNKGAARSVISDGSEVILFDTNSEKIEKRISIAGKVSPSLKMFTGDTYLSRINLSAIKEEAMKLSFDINEDRENKVLLINIPEKLLNKSNNVKSKTTGLLFDTENETLLTTEIVENFEDGTVVTSTIQPVYVENNDIPVQVGNITVIDTIASGLITGFESGYPVINTPDDVPSIDQSAADKMLAEGSAVKKENRTFGNPADLSNTETIITICKDIELNKVDNKLFKIIRGGK